MDGLSSFSVILFGIVALVSYADAAMGNVGRPTPKWTGLLTTLGRYSNMPLTMMEAEAQDWERDDPRLTCSQYGKKFQGYRMVVKNDVAIGLLYDYFGIICGIQMMVPKAIFKLTNNYRYDREKMYELTYVDGKPYWALTAYFIHPSQICNNMSRPRDISLDGIGNQLYYQNGPEPNDYSLIPVPHHRAEAVKEKWTPEQCFDGMGYHNLMHAENFRGTDCQQFFPAITLFNADNGYLHGFGFWVMARSDHTSKRLEEPPAHIIKAIMGPDAPQCILERNTTTLHVFFTDDPANFKCPAPVGVPPYSRPH